MTSASHSHTPNGKDWCQTVFNTPNTCPKDFSSLTLTPNPQASPLCSLSNTNKAVVFSCFFGSWACQSLSEALQHRIRVSLFRGWIRRKWPGASGALEPNKKMNAYRNMSVASPDLQLHKRQKHHVEISTICVSKFICGMFSHLPSIPDFNKYKIPQRYWIQLACCLIPDLYILHAEDTPTSIP